MSPAMLLGAAGILIGGIATGAGLGGYATGPVQGRWDGGGRSMSVTGETGNPDASAFGPASSVQYSPSPVWTEQIICKGCGPTLAERAMAAEAADFARLDDGASEQDPVVRRYLRDAAAQEAQWNRRGAQLAVMADVQPASTPIDLADDRATPN